MKKINHREAFGFWLNEFGLVGSGVEIGCAAGSFSRTVLGQWKGEKYYMVDPWRVQSETVYRESTNTAAPFEQWFLDCQALAKEDRRVVLMRFLSEEVAGNFTDRSLDWVYLDGNHAKEAVLNDMALWWEKLKPGGIMGGHDFYNKTDEGFFVEVESAVTEWARLRGVKFTVTPCTSWWIDKDKA